MQATVFVYAIDIAKGFSDWINLKNLMFLQQQKYQAAFKSLLVIGFLSAVFSDLTVTKLAMSIPWIKLFSGFLWQTSRTSCSKDILSKTSSHYRNLFFKYWRCLCDDTFCILSFLFVIRQHYFPFAKLRYDLESFGFQNLHRFVLFQL